MRFKNPVNGHIEESTVPFLWCFLFGGFYFLFKGAWIHFFIAWGLAMFTFGLSWFIYPFFASAAIRSTYLRKGWVEC